MNTEKIKLTQVSTNEKNPRKITDGNLNKLINSILVFPKMLELRPIVIDSTYTVLGGNMRYRALLEISQMKVEDISLRLQNLKSYERRTDAEKKTLLQYWSEWVVEPKAFIVKASELTEDEQKEFIIKDNVGFGEWDMDSLSNQWDTESLNEFGFDLWEVPQEHIYQKGETIEVKNNSSLQERFIVPPFSILDTRKGYWQDRKRKWKDIIGENGESRKDTLSSSIELKYNSLYTRTCKHRKELGISFKEYIEKYVPKEVLEREKQKTFASGVSLLDPVMAEIVCRWFGLKNCNTFDCFAGDTVFGFVSSYLGNKFTGIEIRPEQAEINNIRVADMNAHYICDDGQNVAKHIEPLSQDLLFSCPPYFDLEVYSDLPTDASNQGSYVDFIKIIKNAFVGAISCLKENRFACICVGDVRDKSTGFYYDFIGDIKKIFKEAGMYLYNEIIIVEQIGATAIRAAGNMATRKVAKTHQNLLVFYKGNPKEIKDNFPIIEYSDEDLNKFEITE